VRALITWIYDFIKVILYISFHVLTSWQVIGKHHVPPSGKLIIAANHLGGADPLLIMAGIDRRVSFVAKEELFYHACSRNLLRWMGSIPVHRGKFSIEFLHTADRVLKQNGGLAIFPEGTRSCNGQLGSAFPGAAFIAIRSGAPVLPIGITGTEKLKGIAWLFRRPKITVNIGETFYIERSALKDTAGELDSATHLVMLKIAELLPPEYQGIYKN
jgi:1-acyl-sn-glycerol-3-phosphate acyltransferase